MAIPETKSITENNKTITRRLIDEFWNQGNTDIAESLVAPEYERIELFTDEVTRGADGLKGAAAEWRGAFPDLALELKEILAEDEKLACHWTFTGTHMGDLKGTPPTGKNVEVSGISILEFEDGKMTKEIISTDLLSLMKQLGVV
ncbi:MAG: ester cyclase [Acidobacteria bacterium]|nr:MAG: ester cyclase [Acidobacteriota bacterium]REK02352.1 MAG: ester cyclase [Acidobacteriota bacterium]REK13846.1 MAG: ester cyclase [Acidobacteriota bacterium]REK41841.1 MAG: ester cyclase [Acidobacteriota bacterium]